MLVISYMNPQELDYRSMFVERGREDVLWDEWVRKCRVFSALWRSRRRRRRLTPTTSHFRAACWAWPTATARHPSPPPTADRPRPRPQLRPYHRDLPCEYSISLWVPRLGSCSPRGLNCLLLNFVGSNVALRQGEHQADGLVSWRDVQNISV